MITVALVDDEPLFTAGLSMVLGAQLDISVLWTAENGHDALQRCAEQPPEVLFVDIRMPGLDGLEVTRRLVDAGVRTRIVMLTTFDADAYVLNAIESGAAGFLLKNSPPDRIIDAVSTVIRGDAILSPESTRALFAAHRSRSSAAPSTTEAEREACAALTAREREVFALVGRGLSNQEICDRLWLSMSTVKSHVSTLMGKTRCRDRVQLAILALKTGAAGDARP